MCPVLASGQVMSHRLALILLLAPLLLTAPLRAWLRPGPRPLGCVPTPAGEPPRHWLACGPGSRPPSRPLADEERLLLGLPLDLNLARPEALAFVPGLSRRLAAAVATDRASRGRFDGVEDLRRVGGIGERRLEQARGAIFVDAP
jgi:competence protein ComEA